MDLLSITLAKVHDRAERAKELAREYRLEEALLEYSRAIFLDPNNPEFYKERAELYLKLADLASAIANIRKALKLRADPEYSVMLSSLCFIKGLALIDEGKVPIAMEFLDQNLKKDQQYHYLRALGFLATGEKALALKELDFSIQLAPDEAVGALVLKGKVLWSRNQVAEGNEAFWDAFNLDSTHPDVQEFVNIMRPKAEEWHMKAAAAVFESDHKKAMYCTNKGLEVYRESAKLLLLRASMHRKNQAFDNALDDLERASRHMNFEGISEQVRIQIALTYNDVGQILFKEQRYDEAVTPYNEAINYLGDNPDIFMNRGDCYNMKGNYEVAMADYHHALQLGAKHTFVHRRLASVHNAYGIAQFNQLDYEGARIEFSRAVYYCRDAPEYYVNRAKAQGQLNRPQESFEDLQRALQLSPQHGEALRLMSNYSNSTVITRSLPVRLKVLMSKKLSYLVCSLSQELAVANCSLMNLTQLSGS